MTHKALAYASTEVLPRPNSPKKLFKNFQTGLHVHTHSYCITFTYIHVYNDIIFTSHNIIVQQTTLSKMTLRTIKADQQCWSKCKSVRTFLNKPTGHSVEQLYNSRTQRCPKTVVKCVKGAGAQRTRCPEHNREVVVNWRFLKRWVINCLCSTEGLWRSNGCTIDNWHTQKCACDNKIIWNY